MLLRWGSALVVLLGIALLSAPVALGQLGPSAQGPGVPLDQIVAKMEEAQLRNKENFRPYTLTRDYKLFDNEEKANEPAPKASSEVIASLEFVPPDHKTFQIQRVEGSDRAKNIVQRILEGESGASGKPPAPLTHNNYDFKLVGEENIGGRSCWVLAIKPLHDEKNTIKGRAWVDKSTYLVHQIQGEMAKTPSWWLKKVEMTIRYGDAAGMWLPTGTYAVADVRIFGKHVLTSQAVEIKAADQNARIPTRTQRDLEHRILPPLVGTGVYAHR